MENNWISVEKELPESDEEVLAGNEYDKWVSICILKRKRWFDLQAYDRSKGSNNMPVFPTHWMPLPEPPTNDRK